MVFRHIYIHVVFRRTGNATRFSQTTPAEKTLKLEKKNGSIQKLRFGYGSYICFNTTYNFQPYSREVLLTLYPQRASGQAAVTGVIPSGKCIPIFYSIHRVVISYQYVSVLRVITEYFYPKSKVTPAQ